MDDRRRKSEVVNLSLVIPCFNEEEAIHHFISEISATFDGVKGLSIEMVFVNDGSVDGTLDKLLGYQASRPNIKIVDLSRNFGKEAALTAGLEAASGHVMVPIDVDLQDPPQVIFQMIEMWRKGYEVVLGRRINRDSDSWSKRLSANIFYKLHNKIASPKIPENVGDFRLMDRIVVDALKKMPESQRFMKGLFAWVGFRSICVDYTRPQRVAGKSKFNGWKLWNFALEGMTSFSTDPLKIWTYVGVSVSLVSFIFAVSIAVRVLLDGVDVPGYASLMVAITFLGGLQLIGIGVIGEYLGRAYFEAKRRPTYLVRKIYSAGGGR